MEENPYYILGAKKEMINALKNKGFNDPNLLLAFDKVPRHLFIDSIRWHEAYLDEARPIRCGQTISTPSTVAFQTQLLEVKKRDKILEIGTGSGYQAAILSAMGAYVHTIERHQELYVHTKQLLDDIDGKIATYLGDGFQGLPKKSPFDKIIVTCGAETVPEKLLEQLNFEGIMVIPVGKTQQYMYKITKLKDGSFNSESFGECNFVPMIENINLM